MPDKSPFGHYYYEMMRLQYAKQYPNLLWFKIPKEDTNMSNGNECMSDLPARVEKLVKQLTTTEEERNRYIAQKMDLVSENQKLRAQLQEQEKSVAAFKQVQASAPLSDSEMVVLASLATMHTTVLYPNRVDYSYMPRYEAAAPRLSGEWTPVHNSTNEKISIEARDRLLTELKRRGVLKP